MRIPIAARPAPAHAQPRKNPLTRLPGRTRLTLMASFVGLIAALFVGSQLILLPSFVRLERDNLREHAERARNALYDDLEDLDRNVGDWAAWDETYAYVQGENPDYIERNLPDESFAELRLNAFMIYDDSGGVVYAKGFDLEQGHATPVPASLLNRLTGEAILPRPPTPQTHLAGILLLPEGPIMLAARPVLTNERQGPALGLMVWSRDLDAAQFSRLAEVTSLALSAFQPDDPRLPAEVRDAFNSAADPSATQVWTFGEDRVAAYVQLLDLQGRAALVLGVETPRAIFRQGQATVRVFLTLLTGLCLFFGVVSHWLYERLVLSRRERQKSEDRYRNLVDISPDCVLLTDLTGKIRVYNRQTAQALGFDSPAGLVGKDVFELVAQDERARTQATVQKILESERVRGIECTLVRNDGTRFPAEISAAPVGPAAANPDAFIVVARDVSERKRAEEEIRQQLKWLSALHEVEVAVSGSLDLRVTLDVLLDQIVTQLGVHTAAVFLLPPQSAFLECAAVRGGLKGAEDHFRVRVGESPVGRAALERRTVIVRDWGSEVGELPNRSLQWLIQGGPTACLALPLVVKGKLMGVLGVFHDSQLDPDLHWLEYLETLAGQAAIAIDNAQLFESLQRTNLELSLAYDETIEGWSRALDLRDAQTEGHSRRVTDWTLRLAQAMGAFGVSWLEHVRRGALLHDIGKMGIPDSILMKPGPLTADEWALMKRHPEYAREMLSPIAFLRPAVEIPFCHHERWDGTGYPQGLASEQIPLAARLFSVVDVWDALSSVRPYRAAWSQSAIEEYLRKEAGRQFDPKVVSAFLKLLHESQPPADEAALPVFPAMAH